MNKIVLITACGGKKESKPMPAGKLYKSPRIRHLYKKSKELNIPFYILSAKYGLVEGDEVIIPYEAIIDDQKCKKIKNQMEEALKKYDIVIYYKGGARKDYFDCLKNIVEKLGKKFIYFGYGNMGDIRELEDILEGIR